MTKNLQHVNSLIWVTLDSDKRWAMLHKGEKARFRAKISLRLMQQAVFGQTSPSIWHSVPFRFGLAPSVERRCSTFLPKFGKLQIIPRRFGDLQDHLAAMPYDFCGNIQDFPSNRGGIGTDLDHGRAHIFLERLIKKEGREHGVVKSRILSKAFERQLLKARSPFNARCTNSSPPRP